MSDVVSDVIIINRALARIGAAPISSLTEETAKVRQCLAVYYDRIDALLGLREWSFAGKTYALDQVAESDADFSASAKKFKNGWRYAFSLPGDRLGLPWRVMTDPRRPDTPLRAFTIEQDRVFAEHKPLWATVTVRAAPSAWTPAFRIGAVVAVAADLCVPIAHDKTLAEALREEAQGGAADNGRGGLIGAAIAADHAGAPRKAAHWQDPLGQARFA